MLILLKSIILSTTTFIIIFLLNSLFIFISNDFIFLASYSSFLLGGVLNYVFYLKVVFKSYLNSKRVLIIYWFFVPLLSILQTNIFKEFLKIFKNLPNHFLSFFSTGMALIICYPISFIFMNFLSNYARKIQENKKLK